jgi:hypothetical protein
VKKSHFFLALTCTASVASATDLGLDSECNGNGSSSASQRENYDIQCTLPPSINQAGVVTLAKTNAAGKNILWALADVVTVGNGHLHSTTMDTAVDVTLEVKSGIEIVGLTYQSALVITRGAKINAVGTAEDPIIFSSVDDDYKNGREWGGVILSGFAAGETCAPTSICVMEGLQTNSGAKLTYYYGGSDSELENNSSSGRIYNVIILEGGIESQWTRQLGEKRHAGFNLYGAASGTKINNIHVHDLSDEGLHLFSGTEGIVNTLSLLTWR